MRKRVFDSYHASREELAGVKNTLDQENIEWYETEKGRWWVGSAGIWVKSNEDFTKARQAIDLFELNWQQKVRSEAELNAEPQGIRWNRVPVLILVVGILLFLMSFGFRL